MERRIKLGRIEASLHVVLESVRLVLMMVSWKGRGWD